MKINAVAGPLHVNGQDLGRTASPDKMERAKAIARGETPQTPTHQEAIQKELSTRQKIKMFTQRTVGRDHIAQDPNLTDEETVEEAPQQAAEGAVSTSLESNDGVSAEATQPLSPQVAALMKEKRALQVMKREFEQEKAKYDAQKGDYISVADLQANPLKIFDAGLTYERLTDAIVSNQNGFNPDIQALKQEIKALKEGVDKTFGDRDQQAEQAAFSEMGKEAERIIAMDGDQFEIVRETKSVPTVLALIKRVWTERGEILDVHDALTKVEDDLLQENIKRAQMKKVQSRIAQQASQELQPQPQQKQMRTLTARDGATAPLGRKARALAAFSGTLKR